MHKTPQWSDHPPSFCLKEPTRRCCELLKIYHARYILRSWSSTLSSSAVPDACMHQPSVSLISHAYARPNETSLIACLSFSDNLSKESYSGRLRVKLHVLTLGSLSADPWSLWIEKVCRRLAKPPGGMQIKPVIQRRSSRRSESSICSTNVQKNWIT